LKRKGKKAFFYMQTKYKHRDGVEEYTKVNSKTERTSSIEFTSTKDLGKTVSKWPNKSCYFYDHDIERNDPDLVATVEKLGDNASGPYGELEVVEIPDGINWTIDNYDGMESVEEAHRSW
jgi:hypothetical protein